GRRRGGLRWAGAGGARGGAARAPRAPPATPYLATLAAWLDHFGDPQSAARVLRVHTNTLRYRLRKLDEVAPVDVSSPRTRLALRLQLAAMDQMPPHDDAGEGRTPPVR
ncbi:helix-turn-helix domain-containing protein, partial [Streptomyces sp. NPDC059515]|uniref:helix-turn-helix domain-containing protein n=1 Tax=Streptomyces sp. NPDC059515 TaxID=3346854 RepID=UPI0036945F3B